jgi:hypothetical protein
MSFRFMVAAFTLGATLIGSAPVFAHEYGSLTRSGKKAYHACLYGAFIDNYCRFHAWGAPEWAFRDCMIANGAGRIPVGYPGWGLGVEDTCHALVQAHGF